MDFLTVRLLGKPVVQLASETLKGLHSSKVQELFCYLLLNRDRSHTREGLATLLWSDASPDSSRKYLRQALWQLHRAFTSEANHAKCRLFVSENDSVRLEPPSSFWLDVDVFEKVALEVQGVPGEALDAGRAGQLAGAVTLYRGDLLQGWYFDWCICERERFQSMYLTMLDKLMGYAEVSGEYEKGLACGEQILKYDRARERTHQRMMRLQCLGGDRAAALRQFQRCSISLDEELGVRPSRRTLEIYEGIRADRLQNPVSTNKVQERHVAEERHIPQTETSGPLSRLRQIRQALRSIQNRLEDDIRALDRAISGSPVAPRDPDFDEAREKGDK
jgi:DNA-binding SARP family transcriptional activator